MFEQLHAVNDHGKLAGIKELTLRSLKSQLAGKAARITTPSTNLFTLLSLRRVPWLSPRGRVGQLII